MKIKFTRDQLLRLNTPACQASTIALPPELSISKYPSIDTIFNNRVADSCRPIKEPNFFNDRTDPPGPAICV